MKQPLSLLFFLVILSFPVGLNASAPQCRVVFAVRSAFESSIRDLKLNFSDPRYFEILQSIERGAWSKALFLSLRKDPGNRGFEMRNLLLEILKNDAVKGFEELEGDHFSSDVYRVELASGVRAIFKPDFEFWKDSEDRLTFAHKANQTAEIAAYEFARLLGLNNIPMIVRREIAGMRGNLQLFVSPSAFDQGAEVFNQMKPDLDAFIYLIDDFDNHFESYINGEEALWGIDYGAAFSDPYAPLRFQTYQPEFSNLSLSFIQNLEATSPEIIIRVLGRYFSIDVIEGVIQRRQVILDEIAQREEHLSGISFR